MGTNGIERPSTHRGRAKNSRRCQTRRIAQLLPMRPARYLALLGFLAAGVGLPFFSENPTRDAQLGALVQRQTPRPLPSNLPVLIAQGTADTVVPPSSNAATQLAWCAAGSAGYRYRDQ